MESIKKNNTLHINQPKQYIAQVPNNTLHKGINNEEMFYTGLSREQCA
jgi:hypothetical protein